MYIIVPPCFLKAIWMNNDLMYYSIPPWSFIWSFLSPVTITESLIIVLLLLMGTWNNYFPWVLHACLLGGFIKIILVWFWSFSDSLYMIFLLSYQWLNMILAAMSQISAATLPSFLKLKVFKANPSCEELCLPEYSTIQNAKNICALMGYLDGVLNFLGHWTLINCLKYEQRNSSWDG